MTPHSFQLYDVLLRNAQAFGDRLALVTETGEERDYRTLRTRVDRLAAGLAAEGLGKGDRVCVLALNSAAFFELYLAAARLGLVVVPINWRLQAGEVARIVERAQPRAFFVDQASEQLAPGGDESLLWVEIDSEDAVRSVGRKAIGQIYLDHPWQGDREVQGSDPLAIIATAAVDVIPRGAVLSHDNLLWANLQEIAALSLGPDDRSLLALPLFHIAALGHALAFFHAGGANIITPRFDAEQSVALIDGHQVTHFSDFPPVLAQILDAAESAGSALESLRYVTGLDAPETMQRLHQQTSASFWTGFGQCETSGFVTLQNARELLGCAGKAAEACTVAVVDDYDRELPAGTAGEIVVRGPVVFLGYDGQPEVTEYTFRNGWHHTGDIGRFDEQGNLFYVKRKAEKELIKPGGENVYPAEVEAVLVEISGVREACVFGVPDSRWGEAIKAVLEVDDSFALDPEAVREHVGDRIARFKRPQHVVTTASLPRGEDGVVDRESVKEQFAEV